MVRETTAAELKETLDWSPAAQVLDVRERVEWDAGHIESARHAPLYRLDEVSEGLDKSRPVHVICEMGPRAWKAGRALEARGFSDVRLVLPGMSEWRERGWPMKSEASRVWPIERQVRFVVGAFLLAGAAMIFLVHPGFLAIPVVLGLGLLYSGVTGRCGMAAVLLLMPWNRRGTGS